jgi:hypothetical protein
LEYFKYRVRGHGITPIVQPTYFVEGEFGHYALKHWYRTGQMLRERMLRKIQKGIAALGEIDPEQDEELRVALAAMLGACNAYKARYKSDLTVFKVKKVEEVFHITIAGYPFEGKIDLILEDSDGKIGFMEHKFMSRINTAVYDVLPLNLQQLIYTKGCKDLVRETPSWYMWNIVRKTMLRRSMGSKRKDGSRTPPETLEVFEARVGDQYLNEPDKMFFRPPPRIVESAPLNEVERQVGIHMERWERVVDSGELPPMRFSACTTKYDNPCPFAAACAAAMCGHGEGWDAPQCKGLYKVKDVLHPELKAEEEDD